jgi:hypothetical protein
LLAFAAALGGAIGRAISSGSAHATWEAIAGVGLAAIFAWMTFAKLTSETAVDQAFQVRFFLMGALALIGGIEYAVIGHHGGFTVTTMFAGLGIAALGGLVIAAELRDTWHRRQESARPRLTRVDALRARRNTALVVIAIVMVVAIIAVAAAVIG